MAKKLSPKQELFVEAYLGKAKGNATEAARIAGYKGNDKTLKQVAAENLTKPYILQAIKDRLETAKKALSAEEVLAELTAIASAPWKDFVDLEMKDGEIIGATLLLKDKLKALELLGKYHKLFTDKHQLENADGTAMPVVHLTLTQ